MLKKKVKKKWLITFTACIFVFLFCYFQNNSIVTTDMTIRSEKIPQGFDDYKIVQLSDLHSKSFGTNQSRLVQRVNKVKPDLIVFTGDLVDSKRYDKKTSLVLMKKLVQIAPVYYVTGNHEWWSGKFPSLETTLKDAGVQVMRNTAMEIINGEDTIQIVGIDDPAKINGAYAEQDVVEGAIIDSIKEIEEEQFTILLSHRPELFSVYRQYEFDVVFSGHAHGGQFRIPFIGGLVAPNQGLFPKYSAGTYTLDQTTMIVNRGLGNSMIPLRIFNRPEIVVATLKSGK